MNQGVTGYGSSLKGAPGTLRTTALVFACILLPPLALAPAHNSISEITVIRHHGGDTIQPPPGIGMIRFDLNDEAGRCYIYLCCRLVQP